VKTDDDEELGDIGVEEEEEEEGGLLAGTHARS